MAKKTIIQLETELGKAKAELEKARGEIEKRDMEIANQSYLQTLYEGVAELKGRVQVYDRCFTILETYIEKLRGEDNER